MSVSAVAGIIFANVHDESLPELTGNRSMASIPFGGRYRLIDFALSNLVNAGVSNVGLITRENYRSLLDHVGSGIYWDLDRKSGGLRLMPPYDFGGSRRYDSYVDSVYGALDFVKRSHANYIVLCDADVVANVDIAAAVKAHKSNNADVTAVFCHGVHPEHHKDVPLLNMDTDGKVTGIFYENSSEESDYCLGFTIYSTDALCKIIKRGYEENERYIFKAIREMLGELTVYGYKHTGFAATMDNGIAYFNANMKLLNADVRRDLFNTERPILTKTRDDMPTRYGTKADVKNSMIADGCEINGIVKNSVLFRGVRVEKGAVIENSILMQGTTVGENSVMQYVVSDKNAVIGADITAKGTAFNPFLIKKNQTL